jgi:catalase
MTNLERKLATEASDIVEIARDLLTVQARFAAGQNRPLGRGTHTKGICARARFEVFDLKSTVADPELAARLARGLYAKPGVYPATLRFANAASTIQADSRGDVRALSFSIQLPPGVAGPEAARVDYSMNNAPTFPINDAHTFASLMKVLAAASMLQKLKAIWSLSFKDQLAFFRAAILGKLQQRKADRAYQQMRYWGNVPFSHGPADAVKYSAIPDAANPARPLQNGPNFLQDELVRHLNEDSQMSSFDFGIQFLDADRMTRWGRRRDASFWI